MRHLRPTVLVIVALMAAGCGGDDTTTTSVSTATSVPSGPSTSASTSAPTTVESTSTSAPSTTLNPAAVPYREAIAEGLLAYFAERESTLHPEDAGCASAVIAGVVDLTELEDMGAPAQVTAAVAESGFSVFGAALAGVNEELVSCIGLGHLLELNNEWALNPGEGEEPGPVLRLSAASDQCLRERWDTDPAFREEFGDWVTLGTSWATELEQCLTAEENAIVFGDELPSAQPPRPQPFIGERHYVRRTTQDTVRLSGGSAPAADASRCVTAAGWKPESTLSNGDTAAISGDATPSAPWTEIEVRDPKGARRWQARLEGVAPTCLVESGSRLALGLTSWTEDTSVSWETVACAWSEMEVCWRPSYYVQEFDTRSGERTWWIASLDEIAAMTATAETLVLTLDGSQFYGESPELHVLDPATGTERWATDLAETPERVTITSDRVYVTVGANVAVWDAVTGEPRTSGQPVVTTAPAPTTTLPRPWANETAGPEEWWPGGRVVFLRGDEVWITSPRDGSTTLVSGLANARATSGSPDGAWIAFNADAATAGPPPTTAPPNVPTTVGPPGASAIYVVRLDGTGLRQVTTPPAGSSDRSAAWSPDGRWIAFVRVAPGSASLLLVRPDGSGVRELSSSVDGAFMGSQLFWTADSTGIIAADRNDRWGRIEVATGTFTPFEAPAGGWHYAWSPDGDHLVYLDGGEVRLWSRSEGDLGVLAVGATSGWQAPSGPAFSPDGRWVIWEHGPEGLLIADIQTRQIHQLRYLQDEAAEFPIWIPDPS